MKLRMYPCAVAVIRGDSVHPKLRGTVRFYQQRDGVLVQACLRGLPETERGFFGFHIHHGNTCDDGFRNVGSHYNPFETAHPMHAGDLPPLLGNGGRAYMLVFTNRFRMSEIIGRTVIVHSDPDDLTTQPAGNSGTKIGCGVIRPAGK